MTSKNAFAVAAASLLAVLTLACGAGGNTADGSDDALAAAGAEENTAAPEAAKAAKVGEAVRDGKFEFTVQKVKCGVAKVGSDLFGAKAQGQFCLVTLKVKNIGKEPQLFSDSNQKAYGAGEAEYSADSGAGIYVNEDANTLLNEINPGNQVTGVIVFDIPKGAKLTRLELHDSAFSGGTPVSLS
ncbi:DUF4352 domain-containing protein [Catellatospora sichuanensis]|uniref:DUF4352 domain-containing protein n=1 Tax=Catellatospora sichuanensis TaxID=1969805 RepID=UPI0011845C89|nr:DUF4352 domain-containing protein [Catellatospora sichuanensis]